MANTKISQLAPGTPAQSTDQVPAARAGANVSLTAADIAALAPVASVAGRTGAVIIAEGDVTNLTADLAAKATTAALTTETTRATTAEALLAPKASPALTGTPTAPTPAALDNTTKIATTAYADSAVSAEATLRSAADALKAPLASPALTGAPTAPTAAALDNSTKVATTAYADTAVGVEKTRALAAEALLAPLASPALTGSPTAPTQTTSDSTTKIATTAFVHAAAGAPTMGVPGYFFPDQFLFDCFDPSNIDPRANSNINLCTSWKQFYLPFNITITRYRFQVDAGTWTGAFFYAGLYTAAGALVFDIGKIDLSPGSGQYGTGAVHDPGTKFFDASRAAQSSITLAAGWYYYAWGAEVATGALVFPQMGANNLLWDEQINVDVTGISPAPRRWGHSGSIDIAGGHIPTTLPASYGGVTTPPPNITFFA